MPIYWVVVHQKCHPGCDEVVRLHWSANVRS